MNKIPTFPKFKILELTDRQEIEKITCKLLPYSDFHFPIMWCWDIQEPITISVLHDNLIAYQPDCLTGKSFYSIFGNSKIPLTIDELCDFINTNDLLTTIKWIPEETFQLSNGQSKLFKEDQDNHDYVYDVAKLNLALGSEFSTYRRKLNQFLKENKDFEIKFLDLTKVETHSQLIAFFHLWTDKKKENQSSFEPLYELQAFRKLLQTADHFISLKALTLFSAGELVAFAIIDFMSNDYACIPFIKSNINYNCSSQFLMKSVASFLHDSNIKFINFEPDLGIPSLRFSKQSYRPTKFLKKYSIETAN